MTGLAGSTSVAGRRHHAVISSRPDGLRTVPGPIAGRRHRQRCGWLLGYAARSRAGAVYFCAGVCQGRRHIYLLAGVWCRPGSATWLNRGGFQARSRDLLGGSRHRADGLDGRALEREDDGRRREGRPLQAAVAREGRLRPRDLRRDQTSCHLFGLLPMQGLTPALNWVGQPIVSVFAHPVKSRKHCNR